MEKWAEDSELSLIYNSKLLYSFNSGRWKKGYNPDIIFMSNNIKQQVIKKFSKPIHHASVTIAYCLKFWLGSNP